jgi:hypothetical protein
VQLKKSDLEQALDDFMRKNSSALSKDSSYAEFFKRINPVPKAEEAKSEAKTPRRRTIKSKEDLLR